MIIEKNIMLTSNRIVEVLQNESICTVCVARNGKPRSFLCNFDFTYNNGSLVLYIVCAENQRVMDALKDADEVNIRVTQTISDREWIVISISGVVETFNKKRNVLDFQKNGMCRRLRCSEQKSVLRIRGTSMRGRFYEVQK